MSGGVWTDVDRCGPHDPVSVGFYMKNINLSGLLWTPVEGGLAEEVTGRRKHLNPHIITRILEYITGNAPLNAPGFKAARSRVFRSSG